MRYADYQATATLADRTIVFGGKPRLSGLWVNANYVADCVSKGPDHLIGFLALDPMPRLKNVRRDMSLINPFRLTVLLLVGWMLGLGRVER